MATITVDDRKYDVDKLSKEAQAQVASLQFVDAELQRLNAQIAVLQTARRAYITALRNTLPKE
jgi:cell division protein FtsB